MPAAIEVRKVPIHSVSDASELAKLIDDGVMEASRVIAIIGKSGSGKSTLLRCINGLEVFQDGALTVEQVTA